MKPFLGISDLQTPETDVYACGKYSVKRVGSFPVASGTRGSVNDSTIGFDKWCSKVVRFKDAMFTLFKQTVFMLREGDTEWRSVYTFPSQITSPAEYGWAVSGPYYFLDKNTTPAICWVASNSVGRVGIGYYDGVSFKTNTILPQLAITDITYYNSDFKSMMHLNNIYHVWGLNVVGGMVINVHSSGIVQFSDEDNNEPMYGYPLNGINGEAVMLGLGAYNAGTSTWTLNPIISAFLKRGQAVGSDIPGSTASTNLANQSALFKGYQDLSMWTMFTTQASGLRVKELSFASRGDIAFTAYDRETSVFPGGTSASGYYPGMGQGTSIDFMQYRTKKWRWNPHDMTKVKEAIFIGSRNRPCESCTFASFDIENSISGLNIQGGFSYNAAVGFNYDTIGEGSVEFDGNWANIQVELITESSTGRNSTLGFRLYESSTFPSGTPAIVSFVWNYGDRYPDKYLSLNNPSVGIISADSFFIRGITFGSGNLYTVDIDALANNLTHDDVFTVIPIVSGVL